LTAKHNAESANRTVCSPRVCFSAALLLPCQELLHRRHLLLAGQPLRPRSCLLLLSLLLLLPLPLSRVGTFRCYFAVNTN
jgi:hypothetical protein